MFFLIYSESMPKFILNILISTEKKSLKKIMNFFKLCLYPRKPTFGNS